MSASLQKTRKHLTSELLNGLPEPQENQVWSGLSNTCSTPRHTLTFCPALLLLNVHRRTLAPAHPSLPPTRALQPYQLTCAFHLSPLRRSCALKPSSKCVRRGVAVCTCTCVWGTQRVSRFALRPVSIQNNSIYRCVLSPSVEMGSSRWSSQRYVPLGISARPSCTLPSAPVYVSPRAPHSLTNPCTACCLLSGRGWGGGPGALQATLQVPQASIRKAEWLPHN